MWAAPTTLALGVVAPAASDWSLTEISSIWAVTACTLGATTFFLGPWQERAGPRMVSAVAGTCYATALGLSGLGVYYHQLPMLWVGYGLLGGLSWGLGYLSPVSTMMRWFPERKGFAAGITLTAFGTGAALAAPLIQKLTDAFAVAPIYLGQVKDVAITSGSIAGAQYADYCGKSVEVVVATAKDLLQMPGLEEGVYVVGSGTTGAAEAFACLALGYAVSMMGSAALFRVPGKKYENQYNEALSSSPSSDATKAEDESVDYKEALKTPHFYAMWSLVLGNAFAGLTLIANAKTMITDIFGSIQPNVVNATFATAYVGTLSLANAAGRFTWALASDYLGRPGTYYLFGTAIPIVATIPWLTQTAETNSSLMLFYGGTCLCVSYYGGLFSALPAYLSDVFGTKYMGSIHGRVVTAWSVGAMTGPLIASTLRDISYKSEIMKLVEKVGTSEIEKHFGTGNIETMIQAKTINIARLMEIMAERGEIVADPTPHLYDTAMYGVCGMLTVAVGSNFLLGRLGKPNKWIKR
eukprot:g434.t1